MTALALDHGAPLALTPSDRPGRARVGGSHLRLVPDVAPAVARPAYAPASRPRLRLTRRARLLRTLVVALVLVGAATALVARLSGPDPLVADHATTVRPGQTLSQLAAEQLPSVPVTDGVSMLVRLNGLTSPEVPAGRSLLVPAA